MYVCSVLLCACMRDEFLNGIIFPLYNMNGFLEACPCHASHQNATDMSPGNRRTQCGEIQLKPTRFSIAEPLTQAS